MKTDKTTPEQRKLKFAEAGILFVLILAVILAVGLKVTSHNDAEPVVATVEQTAPIDAAEARERIAAGPGAVEPGASGSVAGEPGVQAEAATPVAAAGPRYDDSVAAIDIYRDGETAYFDRDYENAVDAFAAYTGRLPENAWGHYMLGLSLWKAGAPQEAVPALQTALELRPEHVKSNLNLARVLLELGRADEAKPLVDAVIASDPDASGAYRMLGRIAHALGDADAATAAYTEATVRDTTDVWSLNNLGLVFIEQGEYEKALAPLARAVTLDPGIACFQNNLGAALERTGHNSAAAVAYAAALECGDGHDTAAASLARVEAMPESADSGPVDLGVLAAGFGVEEAPTVAEMLPVESIAAE